MRRHARLGLGPSVAEVLLFYVAPVPCLDRRTLDARLRDTARSCQLHSILDS